MLNNKFLTVFDKIEQKSRVDGRKEGRKEGVEQTLLALTLKLLAAKFPKAPGALKKKLTTANATYLARYYDKLLAAKTLDEIVNKK